ncbi:MAG: formate--tetrahydrofolate ligase [Alphaproteobacteria bacterium]
MTKSDIEIARAAELKPIEEIADAALIPRDVLYRYGPHKGKVSIDWLSGQEAREDSKLILVTAINPTPAGEGKTTTTVGLGDALKRIGKGVHICLREPSLGPCFGVKGGAAGGGYAQVVPMEDINLHFTGDFHAIGVAHNLLSAMLDNHIYWGNDLGIDARRVSWRRVLDMNDRALRQISGSLGGVANGFPREDGFDIVVASEVMAIFCLSRDLADLRERLGRIVVARRRDKTPVTAEALKASGAMAVLLRDALSPNLVQTLEGTPAFIHGGPFANIAHGCNSVIATQGARKLAEYTVTEAGFGADLGAEKFLNIKCRKAGLSPDVVVVVATVRALKQHGGVGLKELGAENPDAVARGCLNLERHLENLAKFGVPAVVAINRFSQDSEAELAIISERTAAYGARAVLCSHWADGSAGTEALAREVVALAEGGTADFRALYEDGLPLWEKVETIAREIYRADSVNAGSAVRAQFAELQETYGNFPVCMAKTQYSFSSDPALKGAPVGHELTAREVRLSAGAGFVVVICGDIMTMPGLPRTPAAESIHLDGDGLVQGLF